MPEMVETSVGVFEVDWWFAPSTGELSIGLDADGGRADLPEIIDVPSEADLASAPQCVGGPYGEAQVLAQGLWERRWLGPEHSG